MISADPPTFEYSDPLDELRESASPHGHRTQVDVLLTGQSTEGPVALLVEVKLAETDFGWCSAATSAKNDRTDICARSGPFGREPAGCFQLRNFNAAARRRYDEFVEPSSSVLGARLLVPAVGVTAHAQRCAGRSAAAPSRGTGRGGPLCARRAPGDVDTLGRHPPGVR